MTKTQYLVVGFVAAALIAAYVIVTVTNHDGNGILGILIGWLGGSGVKPVTEAVTKAPGA